ncbi:MAG TPA: o-succinylbenzoate synthase [Thermoanaerobaculia bacterium]|nr:o-succinylbenzoate synthase [Thermoanaerobaculia bacterium]
MQIRRVELREIHLALLHPFETSSGRTTERHVIVVRVEDGDGGEGWGECVADENPYYSEEWTESAWAVMTRFLAPLLVAAPVASAGSVDGVFAHVRGNRMAKAALETACWDLEARSRNLPLWQLLGGSRIEIASGVSIGLQPTTDALLERVRHELEAGYQRIKIKIKPGHDLELVRAVRGEFPEVPLMVDANSAYRLRDAALLRELDRWNLMMIEQPLAHDDIAEHAKLQRQLSTPICLDESIRSSDDARHAIELGACRIINIKLGRVGGLTEARRVEQVCRENGIPVWCGGMLEAGIGRAHNIALSTLEGFSLPGDVSASARYWEEDIIDPPVTVSPRGTIFPPSGPGIGFAVKRDRVEMLTARKAVIEA